MIKLNWSAGPVIPATTAGSAVKVIPAHGQKIVGGWLIGCAGMCAGAILLGGLTR